MSNLNKLAIALALAGTSLTAQATVVTEWSYSTLASFTSADFSSGTGSTYSSPAVLSWGSSSVSATTPSSGVDRSYLTIGNGVGGNGLYNGAAATGSVFTDGAAVKGDIFTHWNNTISGNYGTLTGGIVHDTLTLTPLPLSSSSVSVDAPTLDFSFHFVETSNESSNALCPGSNVGSTTPCGDLFGFQGTPNFNLPFSYGSGYGDGVVEQYYASVIVFDPRSPLAIPIYWLNDGQCAALGFAAGYSTSATTQSNLCQGFITNEERINQVQFGFAITSVPITVPEPSMPAVIGVALFALGLSRRALRKG